ncbi:HTH-type transcriptional activator RhaS [Asticcacaulis sp. MM231]|uniref:helix-turn-helix transcriptional regulator n=1 Tax=Asticcacaulis sp. MM231 TaxID=3157666 RepID=UPI0032D56998
MVTDTTDGEAIWAYEGDDFASCHKLLNSLFEWHAAPLAPELPFTWKLNITILRGPESSQGRMLVGHFTVNAAFRQTPAAESADFVVHIPTHGHIEMSYPGMNVRAGEGQAAIYQPLAASSLSFFPAKAVYEGCFVKMSFVYAQQFLSETLHHPIERNLNLTPLIDMADERHQFFCGIITSLRSRTFSVLSQTLSASLQKRIIETFTQLLLETVPHRYSQRLQSQQAMPLPNHIRLAQKYLERHVLETPSIADVARVANVSVRTLEVNFRTYLDMTPRTYLRVLRLRMARQALLSAQETRPIADIARSLGFAHISRFSKYYADLFGETPSDTRRHAFV